MISNHITWENNSPFSKQFQDIYFNPELGKEESEYVFIKANDLQKRWEKSTTNSIFNICEFGYGTGLNFLNCLSLFSSSESIDVCLHYYSCELFPLGKPDIKKAMQGILEFNAFNDFIMEHYDPQKTGWQEISIVNQKVVLHLFIGDVEKMLMQIKAQKIKMDAWFLDGFSPAKNPEMWTHPILALTGELSKNNATLSSFTSAGHVRRGLVQAGWNIQKKVGFGKKREMIVGIKK